VLAAWSLVVTRVPPGRPRADRRSKLPSCERASLLGLPRLGGASATLSPSSIVRYTGPHRQIAETSETAHPSVLRALLVIRSHLSTWTITLALAGPAVVAFLGAQLAPKPLTLAAHAISLLAIALITLGVYAWAILSEGYALKRLGFGQCSWVTPLLAIALTAFFALVFGPIACWVLSISGSQSFDVGIEAVGQLPTAYLILTIVIVAPAEEFLFRGYAIARLSDLTGSCLLASIASVGSVGLAHVPMWGWAPAVMTIVSGGIGTAVYLWRQDIVAVIVAHIAMDLYGIVLAPNLARAVAN
jgi:uncharacterized protein